MLDQAGDQKFPCSATCVPCQNSTLWFSDNLGDVMVIVFAYKTGDLEVQRYGEIQGRVKYIQVDIVTR